VVSPRHCDGTLGAVRVGRVRVPPRATCRLLGTTVGGGVRIGPAGTLVARRAAIRGDVVGRSARLVEITAGSSVGGRLALARGGAATVRRAEIGRELVWTAQAGRLMVHQSLVRGSLMLARSGGPIVLTGNRIGGDLRCSQNRRTPVRGANQVLGRREGQCAPPVETPRRTDGPVRRARPPRPPCAGDSVSDDPSDDACGDG
jgi:hypothetical protein